MEISRGWLEETRKYTLSIRSKIILIVGNSHNMRERMKISIDFYHTEQRRASFLRIGGQGNHELEH